MSLCGIAMYTFCILVVLMLLLWIAQLLSRPKNLPPGPLPLPIIGSIYEIRRMHPTMFHLALHRLGQCYGPVATLYFGFRPLILLTGQKVIQEAISKEDFSARPPSIIFSSRSFGKNLGVLFSYGPTWREQRRFTLRHLRDFGFGKSSMEGLILQEVADLINGLRNEVSNFNGIPIYDAFKVPLINVLWALMAGEHYDADDSRFMKMMDCVDEFFRNGNPTGGPIAVFPFIRFVPPFNKPFLNQMKATKNLQDFIKESIDEHRQTYDPSHMRDFMDVFLKEMEDKEPNTGFTVYSIDIMYFKEQQLITVCLDMFLAGTETTSNSLAFAFLLLLLNPTVQARLHSELDSVIGRDRSPTLQDKGRLTYVEATTMEIMRFSSVAPITPPHYTTAPTTLQGFSIPKGTSVFVNLWSVHMDKKHWGDPDVFRPERFIDQNGAIRKDEWLMPFGVGPRTCLGESLARSTFFLFFTSLLQNFSFHVPPGKQLPSLEPLTGFTLAPQPFKAVIKSRI